MTTERRDDAIDDAADVIVVVELDVAEEQAALALEIDLLGAVDHDFGDGRVVEQWLDGAKADDVGGELLEQALLLGAGEDEVFGFDDLVEQILEAQADLVDHGRIEGGIELRDELALDAVLQAALCLAGLVLGHAGSEAGFGQAGRRVTVVTRRRSDGHARCRAAMFEAFEQRHRLVS